jgi:hypothetical protein
VGTQWHESFYEDPTSLFEAAQLADAKSLGGMGIWALGMDGNDPAMLSALLGFAPATKEGAVGPPTTTTTTTTASSPTTTTTGSPPTTPTTTTTTTPDTSTTTSTSTTTTSTTVPPSHTYSGIWNGTTVAMTQVRGSDIPTVDMTKVAGHLSGFTTDDSAASCLATDPPLAVYLVPGTLNEYLVVAQTPTNCADADFTFIAPS